MERLTFVTGNPNKAKYLSHVFDIPVEHTKLDLAEIQSLDLKEIVIDKAARAYAILKTPLLVEDISLTFVALNKLPGPLIKWFLESLGNEGLCRLLDGKNDRTALAEVEFAYCDEAGVQTFGGFSRGSIAPETRGQNGYGWDPIFIPEGSDTTWGEMEDADRFSDTHLRRIALEKLKEFLKQKP